MRAEIVKCYWTRSCKCAVQQLSTLNLEIFVHPFFGLLNFRHLISVDLPSTENFLMPKTFFCISYINMRTVCMCVCPLEISRTERRITTLLLPA